MRVDPAQVQTELARSTAHRPPPDPSELRQRRPLPTKSRLIPDIPAQCSSKLRVTSAEQREERCTASGTRGTLNKTSINPAVYGEPFIKRHGLFFLTVASRHGVVFLKLRKPAGP